MHKYRLRLAVVTAWFVVLTAQATVSLDRVIQPDITTGQIGQVKGMVTLANDRLAVLSDDSLLLLTGEQLAKVELTGKGKAFAAGKLGGISRMGEGLVVSHYSDGVIASISVEGSLLRQMAVEGDAQGELSDPQGLVWTPSRRIYVADSDNNRVSVFGDDGVFLYALGTSLPEKQRLRTPLQVAVDNLERVYVLEKAETGAIAVFDAEGVLIKRLDAPLLQKITAARVRIQALAVDETGLLYLADTDNGRIFQIDWEKEQLLDAFGSKGDARGQFKQVSSLAVVAQTADATHLAVADSGNHKIEIYKLTAKPRDAVDSVRLPTVLLAEPVPAKCDSAHRLANDKVLCVEAKRLGLLGARGELLKQIAGKFVDVSAAASDAQSIAVVDDGNIKLYSLEGDAQFQGSGYAGDGSAIGKLDAAKGIFLRGDKIYVADTDNKRVQIFTRDGIYLDQISNPKEPEKPWFAEPVGIAVDAQGNIFVADAGLQQLLVFSAERKLLYKLGGEVEENKRTFTQLYDIAMDADSNLYVLCETPGNRFGVQVYRGPKKILSFAAYSDAPGGLSDAVNVSFSQSKKTIIGVYDHAKKQLLNFSYSQVPARASGVQVTGATRATQLRWPPVPGSFIAGYNVYGGAGAEAEFNFITKVDKTEVSIEHKTSESATVAAPLYYKVSAVSGLGTEGKLSRAEQDVFHSALLLIAEKQYQKAAELLTQVIADSPQHADALKYLGQTQLELKQTDAAVQSFTALSKISGHEAEGLNLLIRGLTAAGEYIAARAVVDDLIAKKTADTQAYVYCGELSLKLNDAIGAVTCLEEAQKRDPKNIRAYLLMGEAYIRLGVLDKGLAEFDTAAGIAPDNAEIWHRAGRVMQSLNRHQEAVDKFAKALAISPDFAAARLDMARSYLLLKQLDQVRSMAITLAGQPDTAAQGQYLLGLVALAEDKNGEALLALAKATRLDDKNADAWLALADTYVRLGQRDKLRETLVSAVAASQQSFDAHYRLGKLDVDNKRFADAVTALAVAVGLRGEDYNARYYYAVALSETGNVSRASEEAQQAAKLKPDDVAPLVLLSHIANREGKIAKAIDYMKQAMDKQPNSSNLHAELGALYIDNNLFDQAQPLLEKSALLDATSALPQVLLGNLFSKRRLFDKAIVSYEKALKLQPGTENRVLVDNAYAEQKKALDFKSNAPQIILKDLRFEQVFSAAYKQYATKPVARLQIQNTSGTDYGNLKLTFSIQGYMDFPATKELQLLGANTAQEIELTADFNNRILEIDEDTGVQAEVALHYVRDGRDDAIRLTQPMTIYGKNAILWGEPRMVGAFVTPKDDTLRDFVRQAINQNKPEAGTLNANLVSAMTLFDVLTTHGIRYVVDPNSPYSKVRNDRVDYVQFGRETLKLKSGDCDDLSVLLAASLENLGVETAIIDVPGHLMMMFNTGLDESQRERISLQDDLLVVRDKQIWIPLEATMIGTSFIEAWAEGARKYAGFEKAGTLKVITLKAAWNDYLPVTLKPAGYSIEPPAKDRVTPLLARERNLLLQKSLDRLVKPYEVMAASDPSNIQALMQVSIIYAKYGLYDAAEKTFEQILRKQPQSSAVHNNRGNIYYNQGEFERAIEAYGYAEQLAASDAGIKVNIAMASYQLGRLDGARLKYDEAVAINADVSRQFAGLGKLLSR